MLMYKFNSQCHFTVHFPISVPFLLSPTRDLKTKLPLSCTWPCILEVVTDPSCVVLMVCVRLAFRQGPASFHSPGGGAVCVRFSLHEKALVATLTIATITNTFCNLLLNSCVVCVSASYSHFAVAVYTGLNTVQQWGGRRGGGRSVAVCDCCSRAAGLLVEREPQDSCLFRTTSQLVCTCTVL